MMLIPLIFVLLLFGLAPLSGQSSPPTSRDVLREAAEIAISSRPKSGFSLWLIRDIGRLQQKAGDYEGALRSFIANGFQYNGEYEIVNLVEAVAMHGDRQRALAMVREPGQWFDWMRGYATDSVNVKWIERLIARGDLSTAAREPNLIKEPLLRAAAITKLGRAFGKARKSKEASRYLNSALVILVAEKAAEPICNIIAAQLEIGQIEAARATAKLLMDIKVRDGFYKVSALSSSAVLMAKSHDIRLARALFVRAFEARKLVDNLNKDTSLRVIADGQAKAGFFEDAMKTTALISQRERPGSSNYEIALAKDAAGDSKGALDMALSTEGDYSDATTVMIERRVKKRSLVAALAVAEKLTSPSRKAMWMLKIAAAYARNGDIKMAHAIADRIHLSGEFSGTLGPGDPGGFSYLKPETWGVRNGFDISGTLGSMARETARAAEVAGAAMELYLALGNKPEQPYSELFKEVRDEEIIRALARAHARFGDPRESIKWSKQLGDLSSRNAQMDEFYKGLSISRRVSALIGVAEGILDRTDRQAAALH